MGETIYQDDVATFVVERNLFIGLYRGSPTITHLHAIRRTFDRLLPRYPGGVAMLISIHCQGWVPRFDDTFRQQMHETIVATERGSLGSAFVLTGHGLITSGLRAFVNGAFLLSNSREPNRVFRDLPSAADWLGALPGMSAHWSTEELLDCGLTLGVGSGVWQRAG